KKQATAWKTSFPAVAFSFSPFIFALAKTGLLSFIELPSLCSGSLRASPLCRVPSLSPFFLPFFRT
ncbi:MAG: hypothetical protein IKC82_02400, partial [Lentisphaeria bacterium]|nr:hypothetical protein [Lentisphaeria bacterium]